MSMLDKITGRFWGVKRREQPKLVSRVLAVMMGKIDNGALN